MLVTHVKVLESTPVLCVLAGAQKNAMCAKVQDMKDATCAGELELTTMPRKTWIWVCTMMIVVSFVKELALKIVYHAVEKVMKGVSTAKAPAQKIVAGAKAMEEFIAMNVEEMEPS